MYDAVNLTIIQYVQGMGGQSQTMMTVTLSYDRRAIDEEQAADFLAVLRDVLASPSRMILGSVSASGRARVGA